jgi:hypothetical protein
MLENICEYQVQSYYTLIDDIVCVLMMFFIRDRLT